MAKLYDTRLVGGKSAYNYAVEGGYSGTEEEFTQSLGEMGDIGITLTSTLVAGETTLVFTDNRITTDDVLNNVYTSKFGMSVKSAVFGEGTLTLEFPSQDEDIEVKVVINAILSLGGNGLDGKDGADGKSAYEYAVEGGYTGTEEEFSALFNSTLTSNDVVDNLESTNTNLPLSANQGRELSEQINNLANSGEVEWTLKFNGSDLSEYISDYYISPDEFKSYKEMMILISGNSSNYCNTFSLKNLNINKTNLYFNIIINAIGDYVQFVYSNSNFYPILSRSLTSNDIKSYLKIYFR